MSRWALVALGLAITGLILVFSLPPDPWPYVGGAMVVIAPLIALVALIREPNRKVAAFALGVALIPLVLVTLVLYLVATRSS